MPMTVNVAGQVSQIKLSTSKSLWPLFETVINSIQSLEDSDVPNKKISIDALRLNYNQLRESNPGDIVEEPAHFDSFVVTDNGNGFNTENDMNLWLIDDRLAYHRFLASDKKINSLPVLDNDVDKRMDLAVFDAALSYTADPENINSITIVELKRPQRNDADNDPVFQVLKYVRDIKSGKIKKANGRNFGDVSRVSFYCYVIGDLTQSMRDSAESRGLTETQDKEGYFGFNPTYGAYVEVISYDKLLKNAKQRNRVLFDKLFEPKSKELAHPELIIGTHNV